MTPPSPSYKGALHAGAGSATALIQLGAFIPGLLPVVALTLVVVAVLAVPFLVAGLVLGIVLGPPVAAVRFIRRRRGRP